MAELGVFREDEMNGKLHLQVISGLGSRMRAVIGGIAYCEATGKELVIDWHRKDQTERSGMHPIGISDLWNGPFSETDTRYVWPSSYCSWSTTDPMPDFPGDVRYRSDSPEAFLGWMHKPIGRYFLDSLSPTPALQNRIDEYTSKLKSPVLGIHIRHENCHTETVPPSWFIQRAKCFPKNWQIFLCTDDSQVIPQFETEFSSRLVVNSHVYKYDAKRIMGVAAEWYALKECTWVVGSNKSSYSQMAAFLRGAEWTGVLTRQHNTRGGRYEDAWNPPVQEELQSVITQ